MSCSGHVKAPYSVGGIVSDPSRLFCVGLQPPDPVVECQSVVFTQAFDIPNFEAAQLCRSKACADRH